MSDLARLRIWDDPAIRGALSWYLDVAENRRPAKFRIAATVATGLHLVESSEDALWAELDRLTPIFLARWQAIRAGAPLPQAVDGPSVLELCRELAYRMLAHCNFCPWNCRVDRVAGAKFGACKLASGSRVSSHFHHTGEELFYRGTQGSGTIFFTSCNMRCAFCQNGDISTDKDNGEETDPRTLAAMARMALGHAYRHAPSVHHHSGSTGRKHPTSSGSQSMVDNHRFCAAAKSYWAMGFRIYALAETRQIRIRIQTKTLHRHHRGADRIGSCADQHGVESVPDYTP